MGFTIEDMRTISEDRYRMKLIAGEGGWSNSISWLMMLEDLTIIQNFKGKELAVTTGLGFQTAKSLEKLVRALSETGASGLVVNTGKYIHEIPESVIRFCNENDLPLFTVPWEIYLADMIKDLTVQVFMQSIADEQISNAFIQAIESPQLAEQYSRDLRAYFDVDGTFQVALITSGDLDRMDTVERRRISYRMQLLLANLTHNGHFFYYDSCFVVIMNAISEKQCQEILEPFARRLKERMPQKKIRIGISSQISGIGNLHIAYKRALAAVRMGFSGDDTILYFDRMGMYRLLYSVEDKALLNELSGEILKPLTEYDAQHNADYVDTLECFLNNGGSIKAVSEKMFIHRNTILYRMTNIRNLLNCSLESSEDRMKFMIACMIRKMNMEDPLE
ncbi:MAG: PucR family transcriptional regulator ligand-binding domain-containing protein [Parasporobacterium sp.]|nr:PucR family transcriptional regulator ligand-binding domain-containing protein [Parasporobacterium sp.]